MPQEEIVEQDGIQYLVNHETKSYKPIGMTSLPGVAATPKAHVKPVSKKYSDIVPEVNDMRNAGGLSTIAAAMTNAVASLPGEIKNIGTNIRDTNYPQQIAALPEQIGKLYGEATSDPNSMIPEWLQKAVGTAVPLGKGIVGENISNLANFEEQPLNAASTAYGIKSLFSPAGMEGTLKSIIDPRMKQYRHNKIDKLSGIKRSTNPQNIDALESPVTRAENYKWQDWNLGRKPTAPELGNPDRRVTHDFVKSPQGFKKIDEGRQAVGDYVKQNLEGNAGPGVGTPWNDFLAAAGTGTGGRIDPKKAKSYLIDNGKMIREKYGSETATAMQQISHSLDALHKEGFGDLAAFKATNNGVEFWTGLADSTIGRAVYGTKAAAVGAVRQLARATRLKVSNADWNALMADPDARWIATRIAGKKATNPSTATDIAKLAAIAGKRGIQFKLVTPQGTHELKEEPEE